MIFRFEEKHLGNDKVCNIIINSASKKNDPVFQQAGVYVIGPLPPSGMFYYHRY